MDSGQWTVGSGQWAGVRGQGSVNSEQWTVDSEQWTVNSGQVFAIALGRVDLLFYSLLPIPCSLLYCGPLSPSLYIYLMADL